MELREKIREILITVKFAHDSFNVVDCALNRIMELIDTDQTNKSSRPDNACELRESEQAMIDKASNWKPEQ